MSYRLRLMIGILIIIAPVLILMTMNRMSIVKDLMHERVLNHINSIGQLLANEIEENLEQNEPSEIEEILAISVLQHDILRVNVIDSNGVVIYSSDPTRQSVPSQFIDSDDIFSVKSDIFIKSFPMNIPQIDNHHLQILYSLTDIYTDFAFAFHWAIVYDITIFLSAALMAWFVSGFMERPVRLATDSAKRIATGNFDIALKNKTNDAYGQLLYALNSMAQNLKGLTHGMQQKIDTATAELVEKNERLKELDTLKSEFVAMVSHELRTPLTSIIGFARTIQRVPMGDEQQKEYIAIIENEGKHLSSLIEEYLDISKIESGNFSLSTETTNIRELIEETIHRSLWHKNISFVTDGDTQNIQVDKTRFKRVLNNLFENAIRYGGKDVKILVQLSHTPICVKIRICDTGPGIAPEMIGKIFEKFFRGNTNSGGSGLGLTIAKAIITEHEGTIRYDSDHDEGAAFVIELPYSFGEKIV